MQRETVHSYRCPYTGQTLELTVEKAEGPEVLAGRLRTDSGHEYLIVDGIPVLTHPEEEPRSAEEKREYEYYQATSTSYDASLGWLFRVFHEDEDAVRNRMVDLLELKADHRVLETGCGTCRDSIHIARRLGPSGLLFLQDLSPNMVAVGRQRLAASARGNEKDCPVEFAVGNACYLPFPDGIFDAAYHFGGLNLFTDRKRALAELTRVVKKGGKVVVGDEGLAPWHRDTLYGNIVTTVNKMYLHSCPLDCLPQNAREVAVRWLLGDAFYLIDYRVSEGHPAIDLELPIPGKRGGTCRTRYFGVMEGVRVDTKELAVRAAERAGLSMHDWLDRVVRQAAEGIREAA
jgi:ubiquinone/menaquinone biosynthesis C-methylase UbiE